MHDHLGCMTTLPTHAQLALPLLEVLREGGELSPAQAADAVAIKLRVSADVRSACKPMPGYSRRGVNLFERRLRWVKQSFVEKGFVESRDRACWGLTKEGEVFSLDAKDGMLVTVFETENGACIWANFQTAIGALADGKLQAMVSSPPYPILGGREYGRFSADEVINMVEEMFVGLRRVLAKDGSAVINLADVWEQGRPTRSLYQEELLLKLVKNHGFFLADRFSWHNPSKPAATDWVTKRRVRVRSSMETFYWLSPSPHPFADNRQVLTPYGETMRKTLAKGGDARAPRPSGHGHAGASYTVDNGGSIPANFFNYPNAVSNSAYQRYCRTMKLPIHPARFPERDVLDFFVKFLSRPGDLLADFCSGSQLLPEACERLGRRWFSCDRHLPYIRGGEARFRNAPGFHSYSIPGEPRPVLPLPSPC